MAHSLLKTTALYMSFTKFRAEHVSIFRIQFKKAIINTTIATVSSLGEAAELTMSSSQIQKEKKKKKIEIQVALIEQQQKEMKS